MRDLCVDEVDCATLASLLPFPDPDADKYSRGYLSLVSGSDLYPGAACLAAHAAQRMGAGYVQVFCHPLSRSIVLTRHPSVVARSWNELHAGQGVLGADSRVSAFAVGPGFDATCDAQRQLALKVLECARVPVLVDGGALSALASGWGLEVLRARAGRGRETVLTPHGGEARRLARAARIEESDFDRLAVALAESLACTVVLKGSTTYIARSSRLTVMREGGPVLAKAGTGDILAGMIGSLLAQGLDAYDAAALGTLLHAWAGCIVADDVSSICATPEDVVERIPQAVLRLSRMSEDLRASAV